MIAVDVFIVNNSFLVGDTSLDAGFTVTSIVVEPVGNAVGLNELRVTVPSSSFTSPTLANCTIPPVFTI